MLKVCTTLSEIKEISENPGEDKRPGIANHEWGKKAGGISTLISRYSTET